MFLKTEHEAYSLVEETEKKNVIVRYKENKNRVRGKSKEGNGFISVLLI